MRAMLAKLSERVERMESHFELRVGWFVHVLWVLVAAHVFRSRFRLFRTHTILGRWS